MDMSFTKGSTNFVMVKSTEIIQQAESGQSRHAIYTNHPL